MEHGWGGAAERMKTGQLFEFSVKGLPGALREAFADDAIRDFDGKDEAQCAGCLHQTDSLYAVAETKQHALRGINHRKMGLCAGCIAGLIAKERWNIMTKGDRF